MKHWQNQLQGVTTLNYNRVTQLARCEERHHSKEQEATTKEKLTCVVQELPNALADRVHTSIEGLGKLRYTRKFRLQTGIYVWRLSWHKKIARRIPVYGG